MKRREPLPAGAQLGDRRGPAAALREGAGRGRGWLAQGAGSWGWGLGLAKRPGELGVGALVFATAKGLWVYYKAELGGRGADASRAARSPLAESGLQPADPAALAWDSRALGIARGSRAQRTRRSRSRARPVGATPSRAARRAPAAGPGSMRRAALWLCLCALALRLQPALAVSAAVAGRGAAGGRGSPTSPAGARGGTRGGGGEPRTPLLPALAGRRGIPKPALSSRFPPPSAGAARLAPLRAGAWGAPRSGARARAWRSIM